MGALLCNAPLSDGYVNVNVNDGFAAAAFRRMKRRDCPAGRPGRVFAPAGESLLLLRQEK
jgi:hypothetical protein